MRLLWTVISLMMLIAFLASIFFWPNITPWVSLRMLIIGTGTAIFLNVQKHWQAYQQAECTREKMAFNLALDLLGLLITMGAAMFVGRLAGEYFGIRAGFWVGLLAGFTGGFLVAWVVRSAWGRVVNVKVLQQQRNKIFIQKGTDG